MTRNLLLFITFAGMLSAAGILTGCRNRETTQNPSVYIKTDTVTSPNLMTALAAIFALLPLAMGIGTCVQMHQSLAVAIIVGLLTVIPVILIVLSTFLRLVEKVKQEEHNTQH